MAANQLIYCPICFEIYDRPKALPCLHTFCEKCLQSFIQSAASRGSVRAGFECPVCRRLTPPPSTEPPGAWAGQFTANYIITTLIEEAGHSGVEADEKTVPAAPKANQPGIKPADSKDEDPVLKPSPSSIEQVEGSRNEPPPQDDYSPPPHLGFPSPPPRHPHHPPPPGHPHHPPPPGHPHHPPWGPPHCRGRFRHPGHHPQDWGPGPPPHPPRRGPRPHHRGPRPHHRGRHCRGGP